MDGVDEIETGEPLPWVSKSRTKATAPGGPRLDSTGGEEEEDAAEKMAASASAPRRTARES